MDNITPFVCVIYHIGPKYTTSQLHKCLLPGAFIRDSVRGATRMVQNSKQGSAPGETSLWTTPVTVELL